LLGWLTTSIAIVALALSASACGDDELILATTTSLNDSGLLDELVPIFEEEHGVSVKIIAVGTGAALRMGVEGNADVLLTHAPAAELELLDAGDVTSRTLVAYNDFVIVGPSDDPAGVAGMTDVSAALANIFAFCVGGPCEFASRGDDSGTHKKELALWADAEIDPADVGDDWYLEVGQGMSATLTVANQRGAYTLTDRGTYLALSEDIPELVPHVSGDARLLNFYSVMEVNGEKGRINTEAAEAFKAFLLREDVQELIGGYLRERYGRPLFVPAAGETEGSVSARSGVTN
jgi:tungstate transport system substrate-binding protein